MYGPDQQAGVDPQFRPSSGVTDGSTVKLPLSSVPTTGRPTNGLLLVTKPVKVVVTGTAVLARLTAISSNPRLDDAANPNRFMTASPIDQAQESPGHWPIATPMTTAYYESPSDCVKVRRAREVTQ